MYRMKVLKLQFDAVREDKQEIYSDEAWDPYVFCLAERRKRCFQKSGLH